MQCHYGTRRSTISTHVSVPLFEIDALENGAKEELKHTAQKMIELDWFETASGSHHPKVDFETGIGPVTYVVTNVAKKHNLSLVIMGMTGNSSLGQFLLGSNSRAMVESASFPILLVPANVRFKKLSKIAFATDLSETDTAVIHVLAGFARVFNAEILLVHISDHLPGTQVNSKKRIDTFLNGITNKVNYHKIYYQHVLDKTVDDGLEWLAEFGKIQMLAMVHRKHSVLHRLFKGSHTQRLRRKIEIPLLVFPSECSNRVL